MFRVSRAVRRTYLYLGLLTLLGCGAAPVQEMSNARQALQAAETAGAYERSPELFNLARYHISQAERSLSEGEFTVARWYAEAAKTYALRARQEALLDKRP